jgi:uncharacterized protein (DUF1015 family)
MDIRPFHGWRYDPDREDLSDLIAPPYDVLSGEDKDILLAASEHNIVAVDLPHVPPKEVGPESAYEEAAQRLRQWQSGKVMIQDREPAIYVYEQTYEWAGKTHTRRAMLCGVRATEFGEDIMPHEHTFAGPKADRLKLTEHTGCQLSPIFGFYHDPQGAVGDALAKASRREPDARGWLNGVEEKLWVVDDADVVAHVAATLCGVKAYIADGHHRYTTAMNYAKSLREEGKIDHSHEANFVMFALVSDQDEGLIILPTHRVISGLGNGFSMDTFLDKAGEYFELTTKDAPAEALTDADAFLEEFGPHAMAFVGNDGRVHVGVLKDVGCMKDLAPDECDAWRELDVAILHRLVIETLLADWTNGEPETVYTPDGEQARKLASSGDAQLSIILRGTPLEAVSAIADAEASMPHKSTYFYPKLATGMVIKPLNL